MNTIFKNAEDAALTEGFDQLLAKDKQGRIFFTRFMGNVNCSCVNKSDQVIGCITVIPNNGMKKAQFVRV